jgi:1-deoxy-D-xylulose-5-phosphate reductoisomerase
VPNIAILGCTGSIGDSTFRVLEGLGEAYQVTGLSGGRNVAKLLERAQLWKPQVVCIGGGESPGALGEELPGTRVVVGEEGLLELATMPEADIVINGLVGGVGLQPTLAALEAGKVVAMANKEPLIMAGGLILETARKFGGTLLPLDSEPNALWQCLKGEEERDIDRLIITASGGPFFGRKKEQMRAITPAQALDHPTWKMGPKITVDSATLMNKGFEVIEAGWLFDVSIERVDVVIHRESVVHSMVEFVDGAILAHLGKTDMLLPIQYALTHPRRQPSPLGRLDLAEVGQLSFASPDRENFPCLELCYRAGRGGGTGPAALNAANEVGVEAFLAGRIGFLEIGEINEFVLEKMGFAAADSLEAVLEADARGRRLARERVERRG